MDQTTDELCSIRLLTRSDIGFLGLASTVKIWRHFAAFVGDSVMARSPEWEFIDAGFAGTATRRRRLDQETHQRESSYQDLLRRLLSEGWQPVSSDNDGRCTLLRRSTSVRPPSAQLADTGWMCRHCGHFNTKSSICETCGAPGPRGQAADVIDALERLAALKTRGLITQEEYDAAKTKLLA
jgi:hypothetical protein